MPILSSAIEQLALLPLDSTSETSEVQKEVVEKAKGKGRKPKDITGVRYGRLVVVELTTERANGGAVWVCQCDCGNKVRMAIASLRMGSKSCGCLGFGHGRQSHRRNGVGTLKSRALTFQRQENANAKSLFDKYRRAALKRGYSWGLSFGEFIALTVRDCHYCGEPPTQEHVERKGNTDGKPYLYNGIDRSDNSKGYHPDNVVSCCGRCNTAKMDRDIGDFTEWVLRVAERLNVA